MVRVAALIAIALLLAPSLVAAQAPVGIDSADETSVSRAYDVDVVSPTTLLGVFAIGQIADTETQATGLMATLPAIFASGLRGEIEDSGGTVGDPVDVPVAPIGDEALASRMTFTALGAVDGEVVMLSVRQGTWIQVLIGMGFGTVDALAQLEAIARQVQPRWPSDEPITVRPDGLRIGGIWSLMPLPEDLPPGYSIDPDIEEGPGPTAGAAPTGGATPTPSLDLPLLPTPTPATGAAPTLPQETPAVVSPIETPAPPVTPLETPAPTEVATPASNPRLALPFTVTVEVFLPLDLATIEEDGSCSGAGVLDGLSGDAEMTLREARDGGASASAPMAAPGQVGFDRQTGQDICYFRATLVDVPARGQYTLLAGDTVLGHYTYDQLTEADSILVVVGGE